MTAKALDVLAIDPSVMVTCADSALKALTLLTVPTPFDQEIEPYVAAVAGRSGVHAVQPGDVARPDSVPPV